ncbi:hypothetical protein ACVAMH_03655 [Bacillus zanthoxyli]|uniref:Lipoprotein n=1 Tax=Bacillus toyonensis TaxID=155322 RepID=A0AB36SSD3_9BACI|nr:hypothetical protein [Bacillus toyonensis]PEN57096.1 hypothetical protein CN596_03890 [Bacillus toyonensis]PFY38455.1 hypothetical protein COL54_21975 [Bacillus toyonensis]PHG13656.1 hypothetical protein COI63_10190 [Bacillus toyonensis]
MHKKIISICIGSALSLSLTACDSSKQNESSEKTNVKSQTETKKDLTSQDELNKKIKQEAEEANFEVASYGEYEIGKKLKITGTITGLKNVEGSTVPEFTLTTEGDNNGMYKVTIIQPEITVNQDVIILKNGVKLGYAMPVTVYGTYNGKDEYGVPHISSSIVETNIKR